LALIGIFDSGFGGLTILKDIRNLMPQYDYIYLGDNARAPYGTRSFETIYAYTLQCVNYLWENNCELIILACNTASARALRAIQQHDLPMRQDNKRVLGIIRPTVEIINNYTNTNTIGILATNGTVKSNSYKIEINKFHPHIKVYQQSCPMWVPLVENNEFNTQGAAFFVRKDVRNLLQQNKEIDAIILGCTHYPLLLPLIQETISENIQLITQGQIVADSLFNYLSRHPTLEKVFTKNKSIQFLTTDNEENFNDKASIFYGENILAQQIHL